VGGPVYVAFLIEFWHVHRLQSARRLSQLSIIGVWAVMSCR